MPHFLAKAAVLFLVATPISDTSKEAANPGINYVYDPLTSGKSVTIPPAPDSTDPRMILVGEGTRVTVSGLDFKNDCTHNPCRYATPKGRAVTIAPTTPKLPRLKRRGMVTPQQGQLHSYLVTDSHTNGSKTVRSGVLYTGRSQSFFNKQHTTPTRDPRTSRRHP